MISNLVLAIKKRKKDKLERKYANSFGYQKIQNWSKLENYKRKYFPKLFWDSSKKGTYRKAKINEKI